MPFIATAVGAIAGAIGTAATAIGGLFTGGSFLGLTGIGAFLAKTAIGIGLNVASAFVQKALNKQKQPPGGVKISKDYGATVPRHVACGLVGIAGHDCYFNAYGKSNKYAQQIYVLSDYPCTALNRVAINGEWVTLDLQNPDPEKGYKVTSGEYHDLIWVKFFDGSQTTANDYLVDNANPEDRWTEDHIGVGMCYALVSMTYNKERNNQFPEFFFELLGAPLYDWRKDSTRGGSGTHRLNDPSTHEYSDNPIVIDYNYRYGFSVNGDMFCGMGMPIEDLPLSRYTTAANLCDEDVDGRTRYRCSIFLGAGPDTTHKDNIDAIMLSCGGMAVDGVDGSWPLVGSAQPVVMTITDDDFITTDTVQYRARRSMSELVNSISGNYPNADQLWSMVGYETQTDATAVVLDRRTRDISMDFPQVPDNAQAEDLAAIYLKENRFEATASGTLRPRFMVLEPGDWIRWDSAQYGDHIYMVTDTSLRSLTSDGPRNSAIALQQRDESIYDGVVPSVPVVPLPPGTPDLLNELENFDVDPIGVTGESGRVKPAILCSWATITDETVAGAIIRYWPSDQPGAVLHETVTADQINALLNKGIVGETEYSVQNQLVTDPPRVLPWSSVKLVTTPSEAVIGADILDGAITELKLADEAVSTAKLQVAAVTNEILAPDSVTNQKIANAAVDANKIADEAVTATKFAAGLTPVEIVTSNPTTGNFVGRTVYNTTDGITYVWDGTDWTSPSTGIPDGSITSQKIADAAITTSKLAANAVTETKISDDSISTPKLQANSIVATKIATNAVIASKIYVSDLSNIIKNPTFDGGSLDGWLVTGDAEVVQVGSGPADYAVRFLQSASSSFLDQINDPVNPAASYIPVSPGETYYLSVWVNYIGNPITSGMVYWSIIFYDKTGTIISGAGLVATLPFIAPSDFRFYQNQLTVPANNTIAYASIRFGRQPATTGGNAYVTKLVVRKAANAELIVDGAVIADKIAAGAVTTDKLAANSVTAGKIQAGAISTTQLAAGAVTTSILAANAVTAEKIAADSITARELILTDWNNLVPDNQIQDPTSSWNYNPDLFTTNTPVSNFDSVTGFRFRVANKTTGYISIRSKLIPVIPNTDYYASIQIWRQNIGIAQVWVRVDYFDGDGVGTSEYSTVIVTTSPTSGARYSRTITVPSTAKQAEFRMYIQQDNTTEAVDFYGPTLIKKNAANLIVDGGITADHIATSAITAGKIAAGAVTTGTIAAGAVTAQKITVANLAALGITVGSADIQNAAITSPKLNELIIR